jgi:transposase InsO family protein
MPWKETSPMVERLMFVADHAAGLYRVVELAERYGVSRKTAYKWLRRFEEEGPGGLEARAPVAEVVWNRTGSEIEALLVEFRKKHAGWGPKKIVDVLSGREPDVEWPAVSTVAAILKRNGLVQGKRRRRREGHPGRPEGEPDRPNEVWGMDFKGQFRTRNGRYCYPFTVTDLASRYLLCCDGYPSVHVEGPRRSLERVFREQGMPEAIRSDNGAPFASTGIARLTQLGVWLVSLGITRQLIQPGRPAQNGKHERMHRTLKHDTTRPPAANMGKQQEAFDRFRREFNEDRPHEGLGMRRPAEVYRPSPRPFPEKMPPIEYPGHFEVRRVSRNGGVKWDGQWLNVGHALLERNVGFEEVDDGIWDVYFGKLAIGRFDERELRLVGTMGTHPRCGKRGDRSQETARGEGRGDLLPSHSATTTRKC